MPASMRDDNDISAVQHAYNTAAARDGDKITLDADSYAHLPERVRDFLLHPAVAQPLKDLCLHILPARDFAMFKHRLDRGDFDTHLTCSAHPMGGLLTQLAAARRDLGHTWLHVAAHHPAFAVSDLVISSYSFLGLWQSSIENYSDQDVSTVPLCSWAVHSMQAVDIAGFPGRLLAQEHTSYNLRLPVVHHALCVNPPNLATLRACAEKAGNLDFLDIKNSDGENVLYRLMTNQSWYHHSSVLNAVSWVLDRRPELIHATDDAGWTALDRYVLHMTTQSGSSPATVTESGMLRLLLSAGAQLHRQTPPGLSLIDYHQRNARVLDKPHPIKRHP